jgi:hypothetical protein
LLLYCTSLQFPLLTYLQCSSLPALPCSFQPVLKCPILPISARSKVSNAVFSSLSIKDRSSVFLNARQIISALQFLLLPALKSKVMAAL